MKSRDSLMAIAALVLAGCATTEDFKFTQACMATQPQTVTIEYGDSKLTVSPPELEVKRNFFFQIELQPDDGFESKSVGVVGVSYDGTWLVGQGNVARKMPIKPICVPQEAFDHQVFKYQVRVQDVGLLDPRVKVIP